MNEDFKYFILNCYCQVYNGKVIYSMLPLGLDEDLKLIILHETQHAEKADKYKFTWMQDLYNGLRLIDLRE